MRTVYRLLNPVRQKRQQTCKAKDAYLNLICRSVQPEDVLQRNVVGDEFWFPDGFFAIDLGNHTTLRPTHYMMRNGGAKGEVVTGWVRYLEREDSSIQHAFSFVHAVN